MRKIAESVLAWSLYNFSDADEKPHHALLLFSLLASIVAGGYFPGWAYTLVVILYVWYSILLVALIYLRLQQVDIIEYGRNFVSFGFLGGILFGTFMLSLGTPNLTGNQVRAHILFWLVSLFVIAWCAHSSPQKNSHSA